MSYFPPFFLMLCVHSIVNISRGKNPSMTHHICYVYFSNIKWLRRYIVTVTLWARQKTSCAAAATQLIRSSHSVFPCCRSMLLFSVLAHIPLHCNSTWPYWLREAFSRARCWHIWTIVSLQVLISRALVVQSLYRTPWSLILDLESIISPESCLWRSARFIFFTLLFEHM